MDSKSIDKGPCKSKAVEDLTGDMKKEAEIGVMQPQAQDCSQSPETRKQKEQTLPRVSGGCEALFLAE